MRETGEYDAQLKARAGTTASLRAIAAGYLVYLAWTIVRDILNGSSTMPQWLGWLSALVFAGSGAAFGLYAWTRYRKDLEVARLLQKAGEEEELEDGVP